MTAIILGGGKAKRLGKDKPTLKIGDKLIIERQYQGFKKLCSEVIFVTNEEPSFNISGIKVFFDEVPYRGPVGGILTGLRKSSNYNNIIVAGDMPFINLKLVKSLVSKIGKYDAVIPHSNSGLEPLMAIYTKNCIPAMEESFEKNNLRMVSFLKDIRVKYVNKGEIGRIDPGFFSFFNINSTEDLTRAKEVLQKRGIK